MLLHDAEYLFAIYPPCVDPVTGSRALGLEELGVREPVGAVPGVRRVRGFVGAVGQTLL